MRNGLEHPPTTFQYLDGEKVGEDELTSPEEREEKYWCFYGDDPAQQKRWFDRFRRKEKEKDDWTVVFTTAEEAEAYAASGLSGSVWDKQPASQITLKESMAETRLLGRSGVRLLGYDHDNNCWVVVKQWPAGVPLE